MAQHRTRSLLSLVVAQITHSPFTNATNVHGAFTKQSLRSVGIPPTVLSTLSQLASGGPLAAKRTIHGSHTWSGGTIYSNIICRRWFGGTGCGEGPVTKILVQVKKWSRRTIFSHLNLVQADQFCLPKLVQPNQKWSGLENRCHLLYMHSTRHSMRLRDHANSINVSTNPSIILSVAHYTIPATFRLTSIYFLFYLIALWYSKNYNYKLNQRSVNNLCSQPSKITVTIASYL